TCTFECITQSGAPACSAPCLERETGLSAACSLCFAGILECTVQNCIGDCAGGEGPACEMCRATNCAESFERCAGIEIP
ncbi:MAG: hypothetical protein VYD19_07650, partial [Myxococcota bacterium]|nr:hypothetical protein [Myxococcota bacterium]